MNLSSPFYISTPELSHYEVVAYLHIEMSDSDSLALSSVNRTWSWNTAPNADCKLEAACHYEEDYDEDTIILDRLLVRMIKL